MLSESGEYSMLNKYIMKTLSDLICTSKRNEKNSSSNNVHKHSYAFQDYLNIKRIREINKMNKNGEKKLLLCLE